MNFSFIEAEISDLFVHMVGNKIADEQCFISKEKVELDEDLKTLLCQYFLTSFKSEELYRFYHDIDLALNEAYTCTTKAFTNPNSLYEQSINFAKHLYTQSGHPKVKGGEFYMVFFKNCILNGKTLDAIGLFKSENKDTFIEIEQAAEGFEIESRKGININKLDKGCLVFNTEKDTGYILSIVDNTNKGYEAQYWKDDFLKAKPIANEFHQTNQFLGITKTFVTKQLEEEFEVSKADQIDLLNRSVEYFKTHNSFEKKEFENEVFQDSNIIKSFRNFDSNYREKNEIELTDNFEISPQAVKKQARVFKSVLKLDKNFHIYIHGNRDMIEQGIDENGRKYYKIYYEQES